MLARLIALNAERPPRSSAPAPQPRQRQGSGAEARAGCRDAGGGRSSDGGRRRAAASTTALEVRERLVEALELDLVGPWPGHELADERLPGWVRPSNWYLTGFLIPVDTPPSRAPTPTPTTSSSDVPETEGHAEESAEERIAAKKASSPPRWG